MGRVILGMAEASLPAVNQEQLYVSSTRAKASMALYTDDKAAVRAAIQRSSQKLAALDVRATLEPVAQPARRELHKQHLERQRRGLLAGRRPAAEPATLPVPQPQAERQVSYGRG